MGSLQDFYLDVPCVHFHIKRNDMKYYLTQILKSDTLSGDMNEKVDHWLDSFEKFHKKYIILYLLISRLSRISWDRLRDQELARDMDREIGRYIGRSIGRS